MPILSDAEIKTKLMELDKAWTAMGDDYLVRSFQTGNFAAGLNLVNRIGKLAEARNHHPDVTLTYPEVEVRISTHSVAGITDADFDLAAEIDSLPN